LPRRYKQFTHAGDRAAVCGARGSAGSRDPVRGSRSHPRCCTPPRRLTCWRVLGGRTDAPAPGNGPRNAGGRGGRLQRGCGRVTCSQHPQQSSTPHAAVLALETSLYSGSQQQRKTNLAGRFTTCGPAKRSCTAKDTTHNNGSSNSCVGCCAADNYRFAVLCPAPHSGGHAHECGSTVRCKMGSSQRGCRQPCHKVACTLFCGLRGHDAKLNVQIISSIWSSTCYKRTN